MLPYATVASRIKPSKDTTYFRKGASVVSKEILNSLLIKEIALSFCGKHYFNGARVSVFPVIEVPEACGDDSLRADTCGDKSGFEFTAPFLRKFVGLFRFGNIHVAYDFDF